jgi:hypothetical protein
MGIFSSLLPKTRRVRPRRKKIATYHRLEGGFLVKTRLIPWLRTEKNCIWLASVAVSKSARQINDWMLRRKNRRTRQLDGSLTGKAGNKVQAIAIRAMYEWMDRIPPGDSIVFRCESADPERQFKVWKRWILRHNWDLQPDIDEELKSFFFYKPRGIE